MHGVLKKTVILPVERASLWNPGRRRSVLYWFFQLLCWGTYCWAQASGEAIFAAVPWQKAVTMWGTIAVADLLLTDGIRRVSKRQGWLTLSPKGLAGRVVAATVIISCISFGLKIALAERLYGTSIAPLLATFYNKLPLSNQLANQLIGDISLFLAWVSAYFAVVIQRRRHQQEVRQAQLSEELQAAELRLLKSQLNPHFLFNALNGVRALISDEPAKAQDAVTQLARTLRYTLAAGDTDFVTVMSEMEMVDDYLSLESLRLADRLNVVRQIDPLAQNARIPVMLLQTLVENAIKHGIAPLKHGGKLRIAARVFDGELTIEVENPRPPGAGDGAMSKGVGLPNSAKRLRLLFGEAATLQLDMSDANRAIVRVRLPA